VDGFSSNLSAEAFWAGVFGNERPVEVEIGPGRGAFLLAAALANPRSNFLGIESSYPRASHLVTALRSRDLRNVRILRANAACVVEKLIPADSVAAYHVLFPDPWWKRRHWRRRVFTPTLAAALAHTLRPDGYVQIATDVEEYFRLITRLLCRHLERDVALPRPDPKTRFEEKALARGAGIQSACFRKVRCEQN
jgi:tRNA (guanine-N7-)-methyltransferase